MLPSLSLAGTGEAGLEDEPCERLAEVAGFRAEAGLRPPLGRVDEVGQVGSGDFEVSVGHEETEGRDVLGVDPGGHGHSPPRAGTGRIGEWCRSRAISVPAAGRATRRSVRVVLGVDDAISSQDRFPSHAEACICPGRTPETAIFW